MYQKKKYSLLLILMMFIFVHTSFAQNETSGDIKSDFLLINKKGEKIRKIDFRGKVLVLVISSSWSLKFLEDFDQLKSLQKETWGKEVTFIYAVADVQNNWENFLREYGAPKLDNSLNNTYILPISSPYCKDCFMTSHFQQEKIPSYYVFSKKGELLGGDIPSTSILTGMRSLILGAKNISYK